MRKFQKCAQSTFDILFSLHALGHTAYVLAVLGSQCQLKAGPSSCRWSSASSLPSRSSFHFPHATSFRFLKCPGWAVGRRKPTLMSYLDDDLSRYCVGVCTSWHYTYATLAGIRLPLGKGIKMLMWSRSIPHYKFLPTTTTLGVGGGCGGRRRRWLVLPSLLLFRSEL